MKPETWKPIPGFEGLYQVSSLGNIKTLEKTYLTGEYYHKRTQPESIMRPSKDKDGYRRVSIRKDGIRYYFRVCRIVCSTFHENTENKKVVNHKDGIRDNDREDNLEWATISENVKHSFDVLKRPIPKRAFTKEHRGKNHSRARPIIQIDFSGNEVARFDCISDAARIGYSRPEICKVAKGKANSHRGFKWKYA